MNSIPIPTKLIYHFCPSCQDKAWINDNHEIHSSHEDCISIKGVMVDPEFISEEEEKDLIQHIDSSNRWVSSQEGRSKQDYGPKINFLAQKASLGNFQGFPKFSKKLVDRMTQRFSDLMKDFIPVEFCILEYTPNRSSYIRPHYDDKWAWGDRLITVNLLSDTSLRLTREFNTPPLEISVKMPARSLVVISNEARYDWLHSINRYDIKSRRIAMTWREFGDEIRYDEKYRDFVHDTMKMSLELMEI